VNALVTPEWRLLDDGACDSAWNMAVDRAIQIQHAAGECPPTVRLYRWQRPTVTLGRFQPSSGVDGAACQSLGIDVVRRFTGGRGVLHDDELTYSFVMGERDGLPRGVSASYRMLCSVLARTYVALGVPAELTARPRGARDSSACYLHATHADLSVGVAKLSGSAQVWHHGTCLQHGSFVRSRDLVREARVFRLDGDEAQALALGTATLADVLDPAPGTDEITAACVAALAAEMSVRVVPGSLSNTELMLARELMGDVQVTHVE